MCDMLSIVCCLLFYQSLNLNGVMSFLSSERTLFPLKISPKRIDFQHSKDSVSFMPQTDFSVKRLTHKHERSSKIRHAMTTNKLNFTCSSLPKDYSPNIFCSGIVTYPFYLPHDTTMEMLEFEVREFSSIYSTSFLNGGCLSAIKRMICATVYLPCVSNVIFGNESTYEKANDGNDTVFLPFIRPCRSLCEDINPICNGLLTTVGLEPDCSLLDEQGITLYANDSNTSSSIENTCNSLPSTANDVQLVANIKEPYIGKVCEGIVTDYYVPASSTINQSFAPWLPPYFLQSIVEAELVALEDAIPRFFTANCLLAQREIICASSFLQPYANKLLSPYMEGYPIYLPSFPDQSVCQNYIKQCSSSLLSVAPILLVNCATKLGDLELFPSHSQVIANFSFGDLSIELIAPSNNLRNTNVTASEFSTECPYGFQPTPSGSIRSGSLPITGTACSVECPIPMYTNSEYDWLFSQTIISVWVTLFFTFLQTINLLVLKPKKQNIFLVCFILTTFTYNMIQAIQVIMITKREDMVCEDNTTTYSLRGKDNPSVGYEFCATTSILNLYLTFFDWWILISLSCEIWCLVYWGIKNVQPYRRYYMTGAGMILLGNALVVQFYDSPDINSIGSSGLFCTWTPLHEETKLYTRVIPGIIIFGLSFLMVSHSLYICFKTSYAVQGTTKGMFTIADSTKTTTANTISQKKASIAKAIWKNYSMLILFLVLEIVVYPISLFYFQLYLGTIQFNTFDNGADQWATCLFDHFTTSSNQEYLEICGMTPSQRVSVSAWMIPYAIVTYGNAIILFGITLNKETKSFWWTLFIILMNWLGLKRILVMVPGITIEKIDAWFQLDKEKNILTDKEFRKQSLLIRSSFSSMTSVSSTSSPIRETPMVASGSSSAKGLVLSTRSLNNVFLQMMTMSGSGSSSHKSGKIDVIYELSEEEQKTDPENAIALSTLALRECRIIHGSIAESKDEQDEDAEDEEESYERVQKEDRETTTRSRSIRERVMDLFHINTTHQPEEEIDRQIVSSQSSTKHSSPHSVADISIDSSDKSSNYLSSYYYHRQRKNLHQIIPYDEENPRLSALEMPVSIPTSMPGYYVTTDSGFAEISPDRHLIEGINRSYSDDTGSSDCPLVNLCVSSASSTSGATGHHSHPKLNF